MDTIILLPARKKLRIQKIYGKIEFKIIQDKPFSHYVSIKSDCHVTGSIVISAICELKSSDQSLLILK